MEEMRKPATREEFLQRALLAGVEKRNAEITASLLYDKKEVPMSIYDLAKRFRLTSSRIQQIHVLTLKKISKHKG